MRIHRPFFYLALLAMWMPVAPQAADEKPSRALQFNVFLDDSPIGYHRFEIASEEGGRRSVRSEARFDVKFLFFTAYKYRHENFELWDNDCLVEIDAETNSNGKESDVSGERTESGFAIQKDGSVSTLPDCVMTFAYWNPDFLEQQKLLNPQTGEYLDVEVQQRATEMIRVGDREVTAVPWDITARGMEITVWYSPDNEWLALESTAKGDRVLRYELS